MRSAGEHRRGAIRVVLVGTGTGVGKTHVACALLSCWRTSAKVTGLKPIETGVRLEEPRRMGHPPSRSPRSSEPSDQERLSEAVQLFHVKQSDHGRRKTLSDRGRRKIHPEQPRQSLFAFPEPISPHLAAREAGTRIDLGAIERWVTTHQAPITVVETAGGLFSPLGHGVTNFELSQTLQPDAVILVALDRLGVLHELTTTLALAAARGGSALGVVLSTPAKRDASTGRNALEIAALGIARPIAVFPRAGAHAKVTADAARQVIGWIEQNVKR